MKSNDDKLAGHYHHVHKRAGTNVAVGCPTQIPFAANFALVAYPKGYVSQRISINAKPIISFREQIHLEPFLCKQGLSFPKFEECLEFT